MNQQFKKPVAAAPNRNMIDPDNLTDEQLEALNRKHREKKRKLRASTAAQRVEHRTLLDKYCQGEIGRDELPADGFGFSLVEIFTAKEPRVFRNEENGEEWDNSTAGKHNPKPDWVKEIEKAERKAAEEAEGKRIVPGE